MTVEQEKGAPAQGLPSTGARTMKQVIARGGDVTVVDVPEPVCRDNEVLVRTAASVISTGTETWTIESTKPISPESLLKNTSIMEKATRLSREVLTKEGVGGLLDYANQVRHPEVSLGYSSSGVVIEVGRGVKDITVGERVACAGEGKACHAEIVSVPRNLLAKVDGGKAVPMRAAAFSTIGAIAVHAVRTSRVQFGDTVGVIGAGLVGNMVAQVATAAGCRVVCIDLKDERLGLAREVGIKATLRADDPGLLEHVMHLTRGRGLDAVMICAATTSSDPLNMAARLARNRANIVVVGRVGMSIERKDFYQKELNLLMSRSLGPGRYDPVYEEKGVDYPVEYVRWTLNRNMESFLDLVGDRRIDVEALIAKEFSLSAAPEAYRALGGSSSGVAVVLAYPPVSEEVHEEPRTESKKKADPIPTARARRPVSGEVNVAVVGPGNFAKETTLPLLRASPDYQLRWVVSSNPLHATQIARRYGFEKSTCDLSEALADPELDAVVITAPNNLHSEMLAASIAAGKVALVEKPLCVSREEFEKIKKIHESNKNDSPIIVGFNRRYAPLVLKMKKAMGGLDGPFVINMRVNAGFVPASKWSQDAEVGGGRVIHECCHFFDLFNFLLGEMNPESIIVQSAGIEGSNSVARDNISVTLKYPSGSIATLSYVAMGSKEMDRERIEIFAEGTSIVLDDFKALMVYGKRPLKARLSRADKGHATEFKQFAGFLRGSKDSSIITTEEVFAATEITFRVDEALRAKREVDQPISTHQSAKDKTTSETDIVK